MNVRERKEERREKGKKEWRERENLLRYFSVLVLLQSPPSKSDPKIKLTIMY